MLGVERVGLKDDFFVGRPFAAGDAGDVACQRSVWRGVAAPPCSSRLRCSRGWRPPSRQRPWPDEAQKYDRRSVPREGLLPVSFAQQRLWFLQKMEPEGAAYNATTAVRLTGALDRLALAQTFTEIIRRHEVLRTVFTQADGQPFQVIHDPAPFDVPVTDISDQPEAARE